MRIRFTQLRCREVINLCDGARLGYVSDLELETESGQVLSLIVPGPGRFFGLFGSSGEYVIPWSCIRRIGQDLILVDINLEECRRTREKRPKFL